MAQHINATIVDGNVHDVHSFTFSENDAVIFMNINNTKLEFHKPPAKKCTFVYCTNSTIRFLYTNKPPHEIIIDECEHLTFTNANKNDHIEIHDCLYGDIHIEKFHAFKWTVQCEMHISDTVIDLTNALYKNSQCDISFTNCKIISPPNAIKDSSRNKFVFNKCTFTNKDVRTCHDLFDGGCHHNNIHETP